VAVIFSRAHRLLIFLAGLNKQGGVARARCAIAASQHCSMWVARIFSENRAPSYLFA
jgi:hypothetical protein